MGARSRWHGLESSKHYIVVQPDFFIHYCAYFGRPIVFRVELHCASKRGVTYVLVRLHKCRSCDEPVHTCPRTHVTLVVNQRFNSALQLSVPYINLCRTYASSILASLTAMIPCTWAVFTRRVTDNSGLWSLNTVIERHHYLKIRGIQHPWPSSNAL